MRRAARIFVRFWAVLVFLLRVSDLQAQPKLQNTRETVEIQGDGWALRYGRASVDGRLFASTSPNRIYFTHGGWLRLIDAAKGMVTNRWHFPDEIVNVIEKDEILQITLDDRLSWVPNRTVSFDLRNPDVPYWPTSSLLHQRVSNAEIQAFVRDVIDSRRNAERSKEILPRLEEAVRRDPTAAWLRIAWGALLRETGDPRASQVLQDAVALPSTDFTELLSISGDLESMGEAALAREAFERGYRDFLEKGNDPRALQSMLGRLILYRSSPPQNPWTTAAVPEQIERLYRLAPRVEGSSFAWTIYSEKLAAAGLNEEARLFEARASESFRATSISPPLLWPFTIERVLILFCAAIAAALLYIIILTARYSPEHRIRRAAETRGDSVARKRWVSSSRKGPILAVVLWLGASFAFFSRVRPEDMPEWAEVVILVVWIVLSLSAIAYLLSLLAWSAARPWKTFGYWSPRERRIFAAIVLIGWIAFGIAGALVQGMIRNAVAPLSFTIGSFAGPSTITFFVDRVPASSERDLLLALAYQQDNQPAKAEPLYRTIPQFAESWNNLGALLKTRGAAAEAAAAFDQALALDPGLQEARLNRGLPTSDFWTEQHRRYLPERSMIALPRPEHMRTAYLGRSFAGIVASGVRGPFAWLGIQKYEFFSGARPRGTRDPIRAWGMLGWLLIPLLVSAVALLFASRHDVIQPPGKHQWMLEAIVPGSAKAWHYLTAPLLLAWTYSILQLLYFKSGIWPGSPFSYVPPVGRPFGVPFDLSDVERFTHPSSWWMYGVPVTLLVANLVLASSKSGRKAPIDPIATNSQK